MSNSSVVVLGGSGLVGSRVVELWTDHFHLIAPTHSELDVLDARAVANYLRQTDASVVVNLVAWADVDGAESERGNDNGRVYRLNATHPGELANLCGELGKYLVHVSTDYVFDGSNAERPYVEDDAPNPLCWYAQTKLQGERLVLDSGAAACVARIEMPFSARQHPKRDFARLCLQRLEAGEPIVGVDDQRITPVFLDHAAHALRRIVEARPTPLVVHVAAAGWTTPYAFARSIAQRLGLDTALVRPEKFAAFANTRPARRPQHPWLDVSRFAELFGQDVLRMPEVALDAWVEQLERVGATP